MSEPVWHDVGHLLPPDDTPTSTPTDLHMAAVIAGEKRLERLDEIEAERQRRKRS
jgi:hypothetical protein